MKASGIQKNRFGTARVQRAFTLIEILIVVVILGVLGAIVIPQLSSATRNAKESVLRDELRFLREQVTIFKIQHNDTPVGYPGGNTSAAPTEADVLDQLTRHSDINCATNATYTTVYRYGPYLTKIPVNPISAKDGIMVVTGGSMPAPDESQPHGWIYNPELQQIKANLLGNDLSGVPYVNY